MIKVEINGKKLTSENAVNKIFSYVLSYFNVLSRLKSLMMMFIHAIIYAVVFFIAWKSSIYMHESTLISACTQNTDITFIHEGYSFSNCQLKQINNNQP